MTNKTFAQIISRVFDPAVLGIVILLVAIGRGSMTSTEMIAWIIAIIILNGLIPLLFLIYFTNQGYVFDDILENEAVNRQRVRIYIVFLAIVVLEFLILVSTQQHQPLLAVFTGGLIAIGLGLIITYYWKISLHAALITFFVAMLICLYGPKLLPSVLLIILVFWSRLVLKRHNFSQLLAGFLLALIVLIGTFLGYGLI